MDRPEPDLNGYREAQIAMIAKLGTNVEFFMPVEEQYPEGTILDPETGQPYDPTVEPTASGFTSATVRCAVALRPVTASKDEVLAAAIGRIEEGEGLLIVPRGDYEDNDLDEATQAAVYGERYEITQKNLDGLGDEPHRVLVWIRVS